MNRQMVAQAVAMLIILWAMFRWWPTKPYQYDKILGRGDQYRMLRADGRMANELDSPLTVRANIRSMLRGYSTMVRARWVELLKHARKIENNTEPGDLVHLKGMPGNDSYILAYYLYPRRTTGVIWEDGGLIRDPNDPEAVWIFTGGVQPHIWRAEESTGKLSEDDLDVNAARVRRSDPLLEIDGSSGEEPKRGERKQR